MHGKREKLGNLRNNAQYLPAEKVMRCSHVNTEGTGNARYGGRLFGAALSLLPIPFPVEC